MSKINETEILNTGLVFLYEISIKSQIIYIILLLSIAVFIGALPFIYVNVGASAPGVIQSTLEKSDLFIPVNGSLLAVRLTDNRKVKRGEVLLIIDSALPLKQIKLIKAHIWQLTQLYKDAEKLITQMRSPEFASNNIELYTSLYLAKCQQYIEELKNVKNAYQQAKSIFERYQILYQKKVVTQAEFEQYKFKAEQALSSQQMIVEKYRSKWKTEANQYLIELGNLKNQKIQLNDQERQYILKAGSSGSLHHTIGLSVGSFVYADQKIVEISPDSTLIAYCYVKPADIGFIKKGQYLRLQIDAFDHNRWGMLSGEILEIPDDVVIQNQKPYFKIKCKLKQGFLRLKNGYRGQLKKGMSFQAHFIIARRSLYQLLSDKIEDWVILHP